MRIKLISLLLVVVMLVSMIPASMVSATSTESTVLLTVEKPWANPGGTVDVDLVITENPGILGAGFVVSWDESLTLVADASGTAFSHMTYISPSRYTASGTNFVWFGNEVGEAVDGTVLTLTFQVPETAENNDILPIWVSYTHGDVIDGDDNDVTLSITDGYVRVIPYIPGDVTGDGRVNARDLVRLSQYISDGCKTDPEGYNADVIADACDVTGDGHVNARDLIRLSQYISDGCLTDPEGYNAVLHPAKLPCAHSGLAAVDAKAPACTEEGNIAYWYCADCSKYFSDAETTTEISHADTVVVATGHLNVTATPAKDATYEENGNRAYWYCNDCEKYFSDEACETEIDYNDTVIPAKSKYSITYYLYDNNEYLEEEGVDNPNPAWYDPEDGLVLENPAKAGFRFDGWYDAEGASGELVKKINPGETGNKTLYARWTLLTYTISYKDDVFNVNYADDTYTVDKRKVLIKPEERGMIFVGWEAADGSVYTELPQGTTGYMELNAKWKSRLYIAAPTDDQKVVEPFYYDESEKTYYFVYSLGTLEGIPLENLIEDVNVVDYGGSGYVSLSWSESVTVEESRSEFIGKTISTSISQSDEWSIAKEDANGSSSDEHFDVTAGVEVGPSFLKVKLDATYGQSYSTTESYSETTVTGGLSEEGSEESDESSVTLSYLSQMSTTMTTEIGIPDGSPKGLYTYAKLGDAKVYGIVAFNGETGNYSLSTYSILEYARDALLYFPSSSSLKESMNTPTVESLPFDVPIGDIAAYVNESCYINYDGNGGEYSYTLIDETMEDGEPVIVDGMPLDAFAIGTGGKLSQNLYTRTGYSFAGWSLTKDGEKVYDDCDEITFEASDEESIKAKVLTLYAVWEPIEYTVTYHTNGGTISGDYTATYTVDFDQIDLPALIHDTYPEYCYVIGWYFDADCTLPYVADYKTNPRDMTLYAKWDAVYNSIDTTPGTTTGRMVIDWRSEEDTDLLNHTDRVVADEEYNILNVGNGTTEVTLIGDPEKVYSNFQIRICEFAENQKLTIRFVDFSFTTNEITAIGLYNDCGVDLTIEVIGSASIKSTAASGSIIGTEAAPIENLHFVGTGVMQMIAGDGATVTTAGISGNDGGVAVYAKNIVYDMDNNATMYIRGGDGSDGAQGADGADGTTNNNTTFVRYVDGDMSWLWGHIQEIWCYNKANAGNDGGTGGDGGNGGMPIVCETLVANTAGLTLVYGDGGDGGAGGSGGDGGRGHDYYGYCTGVSYLVCHNPGQGGNAGDGGNGGDAGHSVVQIYDFDNVEIIAGTDGLAGEGGLPGSKGIGGNGGETSGTANYYSAGKAADGQEGAAGTPGNP